VALAKREALLASASWLFNLKGVDATSLEEVAARVGVTKRVIYHNVGDKRALVVACYLRAQTFARSMIDLASSHPGKRAEAFCLLMHAHAEARLREDIAPLSGLVGLDTLPDDARDVGNETASYLLDTANRMFREGQAEHSIRAMDIGPLLLVVPGVVEWIPKWLSSSGPEQRSQIARELADFCRIGLRPG
jgi:AcrR family transcriptional regulator